MRTLITTVLFSGFIGFGASAQTATIPNGAPQDVLFRGFENIILIEDTEGLDRVFKVEFNAGKLQVIRANDGTTSTGKYLIKSFEQTREATLIVKDADGNEMNRYDYNISRIPDCEVLFDTENGSFSMDESKLKVHNGAFEFFEKNNEIVNWILEYKGSEIESGNGSELSPQAMNAIRQVSPGETFLVKAFMRDLSGITRIRKVHGIR